MNINHDELKVKILEDAAKKNIVLDLENPKTIQDKINWLKLYDVTPLKSKCADKILVHDYCKEKLGKDICVPILKIYDSPDDIDIDNLPEKFVLKCNHGYNMNIICTDKSKFNAENAKVKMERWLNTDFGKQSGQLHYSGISPKCYAEKYMGRIDDIKFWCFNGTPRFYSVNKFIGNDFNNHTFSINHYDLNHTPLPSLSRTSHKSDFSSPVKNLKTFNEMLINAEKLSKDFMFARVDFYEINGICYLGELTFTPANGFFVYENENANLIVGNMLDIK